jgi:hypothetical protein
MRFAPVFSFLTTFVAASVAWADVVSPSDACRCDHSPSTMLDSPVAVGLFAVGLALLLTTRRRR